MNPSQRGPVAGHSVSDLDILHTHHQHNEKRGKEAYKEEEEEETVRTLYHSNWIPFWRERWRRGLGGRRRKTVRDTRGREGVSRQGQRFDVKCEEDNKKTKICFKEEEMAVN